MYTRTIRPSGCPGWTTPHYRPRLPDRAPLPLDGQVYNTYCIAGIHVHTPTLNWEAYRGSGALKADLVLQFVIELDILRSRASQLGMARRGSLLEGSQTEEAGTLGQWIDTHTLHGTAIYAYIGVIWGVNVGILWSVWDRWILEQHRAH